MTRVVVYGATGLTGGLVARELVGRGVDVVLAGRDRARLRNAALELEREAGRRIEALCAPVHDAEALATTMRDADVVVSCAGPFAQMGEPVVRAAIDAGADYLDSTGEQQFILDVYQRYESAARKAGVCAVSSCGFEVALGDWAAALAAAELPGELDELTVSYALDGFRPSAGTTLSAAGALAAPGLAWVIDRWQEVPLAGERRAVSFPGAGQRTAIAFPSGEVVTVPRHVDTRSVRTYLSLGGSTGLARIGARIGAALGPAVPVLLRSPLVAGARARSFGRAPSHEQRAAARFAIVAHARRRFEDARVSVVGHDVYGITAAILAECTARLLERRGTAGRPVGVLAPAQAFDPAASLDALAPRGCKVIR